MILYIFTIISCIAFCWSMYKDIRQLRNGVYLLFSLSGLYLMSLPWVSKYFALYSFGPAFILMAIPLVMILVAIFLIFNFFVILKKEGLKQSSLVPLGFALLILSSLVAVFFIVTKSLHIINHSIAFIINAILILYVFIAMYAGIAFVVFFVYTLLYRAIPKSAACQYIIVHGAGLYNGKVTPLLKARLDKAMEVYKRGARQAIFIVSGGQGEDESISEARAMQQYLIEQGIAKEKIVLEDTSTTTFENLLNSKRIMDKRSVKYTCIFVTNDYHVMRTAMFARMIGLQAEGIGCRTALYYLPSAFIREFIAILVKYKKPYIFIVGIWLLFVIISL